MFMRKLTKLRLLDQCIDGSSDNLNQLLADAFEHFDIFYRICRDVIGSGNIDTVKYTGISDENASFDVICVTKKNSTGLIITNDSVQEGSIQTEKTDRGYTVNITLKE